MSDITYSGPTAFAHLHCHTVYSTLDGVQTPEQLFSACAERQWPAIAVTEHGVLSSVPDCYFAAKEKKIKYVPACFLPEQPIYTESGVKNIANIKSGDLVLTQHNRFRKVLNTQARQYDGDVITIKAWGVEPIVCTPEHPLLVRSVARREVKRGVWEDDINIQFLKASQVSVVKYHRTYATKKSLDRSNKRRFGKYLCVPRLNPGTLKSIPLSDLIFKPGGHIAGPDHWIDSVIYEHDGYKTTKEVGLPTSLPLDSEFLWVCGLWLAEGSLKADASIEFTLGSDELDYANRVAAYFDRFNITTRITPREHNRIDVSVNSAYFSRCFDNLFGSGFDNKKLNNNWLFGLDAGQTKSLLGGLFDGDAKIGTRQSYLKLCNQTLVWQARLLLTRSAQYSAVSKIKNNNSDNIGYTIRRRETGHCYYDWDDKYIYLPISNISTKHYSGPVHNLEVDEDNTYNVGVVAHNCEIYFNDYEPARQKMVACGQKLSSIKLSNPDLYSRINRNRHLTVLAKNMTGFFNLVKMITEAHEFGFYGRARIWFEKLLEYKEGLVILSGCFNGPLSYELRHNILRNEDKTGALDYAEKFKDAFGDDYFIEVQMPCIVEDGIDDKIIFWALNKIARKYGIRAVLTNDCCLPETLIISQDGPIRIDQVKGHQAVLSHTGAYRNIEYINRRSINDDIVSIKLGSEIHRFTKNHPIAIWDDGVKFVNAIDLKTTDKIFFPSITPPRSVVDYLDLTKHVKYRRGTKAHSGYFITTSPKKTYIPTTIRIDPEFCYLLGLYAAEGDVCTSPRQNYKLSFSFNKNETSQINFVCGFFRKYGFEPSIKLRSNNGVQIRICSSIFADVISDLCGNGHLNKHLPYFWNQLNNYDLSRLLAGVIDGDGSIGANSVAVFSTSIRLISDVKLAMTRFNRYSHIKYRHKYTDGRPKSNPNKWNRLYYLSYGHGIGDLLGLDGASKNAEGKPHYDVVCGGFAIRLKTRDINIEHYSGEVYNLQVSNDETYCCLNVCTHNCHYLNRDDWNTQRLMMAISQNLTIDSPELFTSNSNEQFLKTRADLYETFKTKGYDKNASDANFDEICDNTLLVADRCETFKPNLDPKIPTSEGDDKKLRELVARALIKRGLHTNPKKYIIDNKSVTYKDQAKIELDRFIEKGFSSYFLITQDLIQYSINILHAPVGPRGSVGGSLVCYLLGIHELDPLKWGLSFDRFLSPSRGGYMLNIKAE